MDFNGRDIVKRLDTLLINKKEKRKAVCDYAGISTQTITDWTKRGSIPAADTLYKIAKYLGTSVEYLLTEKDGLSEDERDLLVAFSLLDESGKKAAIAAVRGMADAFPLATDLYAKAGNAG
jgi:transcriptional regulator with XRE-family HTH domain